MITIEQKRIIGVMKSGVRLCRGTKPDDPKYFFLDSHHPAPRGTSVKSLMAMGVIAAADDALLDGRSQTFDLVFVPGEA